MKTPVEMLEDIAGSLEPISKLNSGRLNSWATDIGNCKWAIFNAMDCISQALHAIGTLTIICEKLDELQKNIYQKADKLSS